MSIAASHTIHRKVGSKVKKSIRSVKTESLLTSSPASVPFFTSFMTSLWLTGLATRATAVEATNRSNVDRVCLRDPRGRLGTCHPSQRR